MSAAFIASSFQYRTAAHQLHLAAKTYAHHVALGDFYEELTELTDKFAEVYQGLNSQVKTYPAVPTPKETDPIALLDDYLTEVQAEQREYMSSQALLNILAELEEITARTLYKLKYLK